MPDDEPAPPLPGRDRLRPIHDLQLQNGHADAKRKAPDGDTDMKDADDSASKNTDTDTEPAKRPKAGGAADAPVNGSAQLDRADVDDVVIRGAQAAAALIPFLSAKDLLPPKLPSKDEMEKVLLDLRKKALVEEYFGE